MNALANRAFTKMNGLGNEIVVVDMRQSPAAIAASEARAAAASVAFDQMMALYPPRTQGTDAYVRIYNNDGSESGACGNVMRCIRSASRLRTPAPSSCRSGRSTGRCCIRLRW